MGTIVQRGQRYRAVIRRKGETARTRTFRTKKAAEIWMRHAEVAIDRGEALDRHHRIGVEIKAFVNERMASAKPLVRSRKYTLMVFATLLMDTTVESLTTQWFVDWASELSDNDLKPSTAFTRFNYLIGAFRGIEARTSLRFSWEVIRLARGRMRELDLIGPSKERERRVLPGELDEIKARARPRRENRHILPLADIIDLAVVTCMRVSEIARIRWADLNEIKRTLVIRDRKHPRKQKGNHSEIPLLGDAMAIIKRQPKIDERIFPFDPISMTGAFIEARKAWNPDCDLRLHDLRHEGISRLFEQGYPIQEVAVVSGHHDWKSLKRYTNIKPEHLHVLPHLRSAA